VKARPYPQYARCPACETLQRLRPDACIRGHRAWGEPSQCTGSRTDTTGWRSVRDHQGLYLVAPVCAGPRGGAR
jgi:hypothetical protein